MKTKEKLAKLKNSGLKNWGKMNVKLTKAEDNKAKVISGSTGLLIDKRCRYGFPISFLVFNVIYWTTIIIGWDGQILYSSYQLILTFC